jgi:hypothetical protein
MGKSADLELAGSAIDDLKVEIARCNDFIASASRRLTSALPQDRQKEPGTSRLGEVVK